MQKNFFLLYCVILFLIFQIFVLPLHAAVTGKIRGQIVDSVSGMALPGVNVVISHVWINGQEEVYDGGLGAATSIDGEYFILKVPPGIYSITSSMIGYNTITKQQVQVSIDRTSIVDFQMEEAALQGEEVVVTAGRDQIQVDVAATENYVTAEEYQNTPFANRVENVIGLQSGVSGNIVEGQISIRAGDTREVGLLVDGMSLVDKKFNRPVFSVQPGVVQEIKVMRNGFNAEYGQSRSGIINVITKDPDEKYRFSMDYQFTPAHKPHYGRDKYDKDYRWEWRLLDGPNAFIGDTLYLPDGTHQNMKIWMGWNKYAEELLSDDNPDNDLTADEAYELWKWRHRPMEYGNLNGHNVDLSFSGPVPFMPWRTNFLAGAKYEFKPLNYPQSTDHYDEKMGSLKIISNPSPNIKLTLNGMYSSVTSAAGGRLDATWATETLIDYDGVTLRDYYPYYYPVINRETSLIGAKLVHTLSPTLYYETFINYFNIGWNLSRADQSNPADGRYFHGRLYYDPQSGYIPRSLGVDDDASDFKMAGIDQTWDDSWNKRFVYNFVLTSQFHPAHELKFGVNGNYDILRENRVYWPNEDPDKEFIRRYKVKPIEFASFIQDKIEFQGMVANIGLRFDYFNTNTDRPDVTAILSYAKDRDMWEAVKNNEYPMMRAKPKYYLSPRVGISHPLSDKSKVYFNYGHFVQTPPSRDLYIITLDGERPGIQMMGNPELNFEKTIAYELGFDMSVKSELQFHVGAFYKKNSNVANRMTSAHLDQSVVVDWFDDIGYAEIRGLELELRKSTGQFFTGWINYNYIKKSNSDLGVPGLSDNPIITDDPSVGRDGIIWGVPTSVIRDIIPNARGVLSLHTPGDWGPKFKGFSLVSQTSISLQMHYQGGALKEHPKTSFQDMYPNVRFRELCKFWADLRVSRQFRVAFINMELYMDISNIFHSTFRNPPTGTSGEDYYDELWEAGRLDQVGTDELTNPMILLTENDDVYWGRVKIFNFGLRINL